MAIVNGASYGFHCLPIPDYHLHDLLGRHFVYPSRCVDPIHFVDDYRYRCWFAYGYHDCHVHSDCGSFEGNATLIVIDCEISSSMCGSIRNYRSDSGCARVSLGALWDFYLDSYCNHIPLEEVDPADPSDGLGGPWDEYHVPTALEAYFDCCDSMWLVLDCPYGDDLHVACLLEVYLLSDEPLDSYGVFPAFVVYRVNYGVRIDLAVTRKLKTWTRPHSLGISLHFVTEIQCVD